MAVAKKDQERANYAWMYGAQAQKDGKAREVPGYWQEYAEVWLQGFDGIAIGALKPVSDTMEAEVDSSAIDLPG
jgi:hypothetical protein